MKNAFEYQTGNIAYSVTFRAESATGGADINFGCRGLPEKTFSFHLRSGNIYDSEGIYFGSYLPDTDYTIGGVFYDDSSFYFYNGLPTRAEYETLNQDIDYIELSKISGDNSTYSLEYVITGKNHNVDSNVLYITKSGQLETGITELITGMWLFGGESGLSVDYSPFTGILSTESIETLESFNIIVFGQYVKESDFQDKTGWANITKPIIFLNSLVPNQDYLGILSGSLLSSDGVDKCFGYMDINLLNEKRAIHKSFLRRGDIGPTGYHLYTTQDLYYLYYTGSSPEAILSSVGNDICVVLDALKMGTSGYEGALPQSGKRVFFNTPYQFSTPIYDVSTDNWKKILTSCIYDMGFIGTPIETQPITTVDILRSGLVGYWPLDNDMNDYSNGINNGTNIGAYPEFIDGAAYISGGNISTTDINFPVEDANRTVAFWFNLEEITTGQKQFFSYGTNNETEGFVVGLDNSAGMSGISISNLVGRAVSSFKITTGNMWYHAAVTMGDAGSINIYTNGSVHSKQLDELGGGDVFTVLSGVAYISHTGNGPLFMDEVAVWDRELTEDEVALLYHGGSGMSLKN